MFLWHYRLRTIIKSENTVLKKEFKQNDKELFMRSLIFVKACIFVVLSSGILTFIMRYHGTRPFFVNLIFLTIAVATMFKAQNDLGLSYINSGVKSFMKLIGISFFY